MRKGLNVLNGSWKMACTPSVIHTFSLNLDDAGDFNRLLNNLGGGWRAGGKNCSCSPCTHHLQKLSAVKVFFHFLLSQINRKDDKRSGSIHERYTENSQALFRSTSFLLNKHLSTLSHRQNGHKEDSQRASSP